MRVIVPKREMDQETGNDIVIARLIAGGRVGALP
jgi:hypothetical protein